MFKLYIGNKNYSSWSMRPWVLLKQAGIVFEEVRVRFDSFDAQSEFKRTIGAVSPTAKVPVLVDGDLVVWDNRCTMHRGRPYDPMQRRVLHRTTVSDTVTSFQPQAVSATAQ